MIHCNNDDEYYFKNRFANHENSKKHKENVAVIKAQMVEDDESFGLGGVLDEPEVGDEDTSLDHAADSDESFSDDMQEEK